MYNATMPPEVLVTGVADVRADVYHLGVLLYRMVNGDAFYRAQIPPTLADLQAAIQAGTFPDRNRFMPHVPLRLRRVIRKALMVDFAQRHATVSAVEGDLSGQAVQDDWVVSVPAANTTVWTASRPGAASLMVERAPRGTGRWNVSVWTNSPGGPHRARGRKELWRVGMTATQADAHLRGVFRSLSGA
jgi:hypothetical protein